MNTQKTKSVIVNTVTGVLILGVVFLGYVTFFKKSSPAGDSTTPSTTSSSLPDVTTEALRTSLQVAQTVKDLNNLSRSVASSTVVFNLPAFRSLQDFSVQIPGEAVGRENPFVKTQWRLKFEELAKEAEKKAAQQTAAVPVATSMTVPTFSTASTTVAQGI